MSQPWHRRDDETDKAWRAFVCYRDMGGERSFPKVGRQLGKGGGYKKILERWSSKYQWVSRCNDFDNHQAKVLEQAALEHKKEQYLRDLETYRQENLKLGRALMANCASLLKIAQANAPGMMREGALRPGELANISRAASAMAQAGSLLCAEALDVEGLLEKMNDAD